MVENDVTTILTREQLFEHITHLEEELSNKKHVINGLEEKVIDKEMSRYEWMLYNELANKKEELQNTQIALTRWRQRCLDCVYNSTSSRYFTLEYRDRE